MKGQSVVEATLDGAGPVSQAAHELHELEHALADPARADELDALVERFGQAQARFEELGGYALEVARARGAGRARLRARRRWTATSARSRAAGRCASVSRASW